MQFHNIAILFEGPPTTGLMENGKKKVYSDLQRIVNLICIENASESVLNSLLLLENIAKTYHGPLMAIQFWERFKEYFSVGGLPKAPLIKSEILGFCMDSRNLWIQNDEQLDWILEYLESHNLPTAELEEKYCSGKDEKSSFLKFNSELDCSSCGRIMSTLPTELHDLHRQGHKAWIDAGEKIVETGQRLTPTNYQNHPMCLGWPLETSIKSYQEQGTITFHKGQKLATFSMWLAPACQRILDFLKRTPKLTSGSEYIGYQLQTFLELHLNTDLHQRIPDIIGMSKNKRQGIGLEYFRFWSKELENVMQKAFENPMKLDDNNWQSNEWNNKFCNICNVSKLNQKGEQAYRQNHVMGFHVLECQKCGFDYKFRDNKENAIKHVELHNKCQIWVEFTANVSTKINKVRIISYKYV